MSELVPKFDGKCTIPGILLKGGEVNRLVVFAAAFSVLSGVLTRPASAVDTVGVFIEASNYTVLQMPGIPAKISFHFGTGNSYDRVAPMLPFKGKFGGDPDTDSGASIGYYNSRERTFYVAYENEGSLIDKKVHYDPVSGATANDRLWPVVLDKNGDGVIRDLDGEFGVFFDDDVANGNRWYLGGSSSVVWGTGCNEVQPPVPNCAIPVVGDWDGIGGETIGYYRRDQGTFYLSNSNSTPSNSEVVAFPGSNLSNIWPVVGDWDSGDLGDEVGYYDVTTSTFHLKTSAGETQIAFADVACLAAPAPCVLDSFDDGIGGDGWPDTFPLAGSWDDDGAPEPDPYDWGQLGDPDDYGLDSVALENLTRIPDHLNSLLIVRRHGSNPTKLVWEEYFNGYDRTIANHMMSTTKSVMSALYGIAFKEGYFGQWDDPETSLGLQMNTWLGGYNFNDGITFRHLMTMTSGFAAGGGVPDDLFAELDYIQWIADDLWVPGNLGNTFRYYGGNTILGAEILRRSLTDANPPNYYADIRAFAKAKLFQPLDIAPTRWDREPCTNLIPACPPNQVMVHYGPSQMFMRPRDMARFGQLYMEGGSFDGGVTPIVDDTWVSYSTGDLIINEPNNPKKYGAWWWREYNDKDPEEPDNPETDLVEGAQCYPLGTTDHCGYHAQGWGGQQIFVFPSLEMVVVMTSDWLNVPSAQQIDENEYLLQEVLDAITEE